jgi:hypothetical protein
VDRRTIAAIWIAGAVLMAVLYVVGPQNFIVACEQFFSRFWWFIGDFIDTLMDRAFDAVRAAAIALYAIFVVLALMAGQRGMRSGGALFTVTIVFLLLVGTHWYAPATRWFAAAVIAGAGAVMMTGRLMRPPRDPRTPWGIAGRPNAPHTDR